MKEDFDKVREGIRCRCRAVTYIHPPPPCKCVAGEALSALERIEARAPDELYYAINALLETVQALNLAGQALPPELLEDSQRLDGVLCKISAQETDDESRS